MDRSLTNLGNNYQQSDRSNSIANDSLSLRGLTTSPKFLRSNLQSYWDCNLNNSTQATLAIIARIGSWNLTVTELQYHLYDCLQQRGSLLAQLEPMTGEARVVRTAMAALHDRTETEKKWLAVDTQRIATSLVSHFQELDELTSAHLSSSTEMNKITFSLREYSHAMKEIKEYFQGYSSAGVTLENRDLFVDYLKYLSTACDEFGDRQRRDMAPSIAAKNSAICAVARDAISKLDREFETINTLAMREYTLDEQQLELQRSLSPLRDSLDEIGCRIQVIESGIRLRQFLSKEFITVLQQHLQLSNKASGIDLAALAETLKTLGTSTATQAIVKLLSTVEALPEISGIPLCPRKILRYANRSEPQLFLTPVNRQQELAISEILSRAGVNIDSTSFQHRDHISSIIQIHGCVVGTSSCYAAKDSHYSYLYNTAVVPDMKRLGIGSLLLNPPHVRQRASSSLLALSPVRDQNIDEFLSNAGFRFPTNAPIRLGNIPGLQGNQYIFKRNQ